MSKRAVVILVVAGIVVAALLWAVWTMAVGFGGSLVGSGGEARGTTGWQLLLEGEGSGNDVSREFIVPRDCPRQVVEYSGTALDFDVAWASFQAVGASGDLVDSVMADYNRAPAGEAAWRLEPGRYVIEVESREANWHYRLECR